MSLPAWSQTPMLQRELVAGQMVEAEQYEEVCEMFSSLVPQTPGEWRLFGVALLRSEHTEQAEHPLKVAFDSGDLEGGVEYGNLLRLCGRFSESIEVLESLSALLTGELQWRALRWWGVSEFQLGRQEEGLRRTKRARFGYMGIQDTVMTGRITQTLAQMCSVMKRRSEAKRLYQESLRDMPPGVYPLVRLAALGGLAYLEIQEFQLVEAQRLVDEAFVLLTSLDVPPPRPRANCLLAQVLIYQHQFPEHAADVLSLTDALCRLAPLIDEYETLSAITVLAGDLYSLHGRTTDALAAVASIAPPYVEAEWLQALTGVVLARAGRLVDARLVLEAALDGRYASAVGDHVVCMSAEERLPYQLHLCGLYLSVGEHGRVYTLLQSVLGVLNSTSEVLPLRFVLAEHAAVVEYALMEPDLCPSMEAVMGTLGELTGTGAEASETLMHLELHTLGCCEAFRNGVQVTLGSQRAVLMLVYLSVFPGRSRDEVQAALYAGSGRSATGIEIEAELSAADRAFREDYREVRRAFGPHVLRNIGDPLQPAYALGSGVETDLDLTQFRVALHKRDLDQALDLYQGLFLPGILDAPWAAEVRLELGAALKRELLQSLKGARDAGDLLLSCARCTEYLRFEPEDQVVLAWQTDLLSALPVGMVRVGGDLAGLN